MLEKPAIPDELIIFRLREEYEIHIYERIIQDLADYGEQVLMGDKGSAEREQFYRYFVSNFEPGTRIEIAKKTDKLLKI